MMMWHTLPQALRRTGVTNFAAVFALVLLLAGFAAAQVNGAIYTTTATGTTVNGNIYDAKTSVYLNGGPQNNHDPGLSPSGSSNDGTFVAYYFQVTDPSGAVLLSADDVSCRQVLVQDGRIVGVPPGPPPAACTASSPAGAFHPLGTADNSNGELPVQMCPAASRTTDNLGNGTNFDANNWCDTTPNPGGEYKVWLTPVANYGESCSGPSHVSYGFCDADSKTDNFKVRKQNAAYISVCKFNDLNANGVQDSGEPLIPFWPINATGIDTLTGPLGTVNTQTDASGCVSFSVSSFPNSDNTDTVSLTETVLQDWFETAPLDGTYDAGGNVDSTGPTSVSRFVETITVKAGDSVTAPNFGNFCISTHCGGQGLVVTKDANPSFTRTFTWNINKSVNTTTVFTNGNGATFNYTVTVSHDSGTDSAWQATGTIKVSNPNPIAIGGVNVADAVDNGGNCAVTGGSGITIPANSEVDVPYSCTYASLPPAGTNTATATWDGNSASGTATVDFSNAAIHVVDGSATITDTIAGTLGTVAYTDSSPTTYTYSHTFAGAPAGTCTSYNNTATFTTNNTGATGSSSQSVQDCQGADLRVTKDASTAFNAAITKSVDRNKVEQPGGTVTFNYTVTVTESGWVVSGNVYVTNPNDWEDITANVTDILSDSGASCTVTGGSSVLVPRSSTVTLPYSCGPFAASPTANPGVNTAVATWNAATYYTPDASASGSVGYSFGSLTVTDTFNGVTTTLGTVTIPPGASTFTYSRTVNNAQPGTCYSYSNLAQIVQTGQTAGQTVTVCNTGTGALTMGFWKNNNGQGIIKKYCGGTSGTSLYAYLSSFDPFKNDTNTSCSSQASYVYNIISAASCTSSTSTCNSMLRAQMLATALDVYFSTPGLGGNQIGAYNGLGTHTPALGGVAIDLSHVCSMADSSTGSACSGSYEDARPEFGIVNSCLGTTVSQMLSYSNFASSVNGNPVATATTGANWYQQVKGKQVYAKDGFDNINNQVANIAPTSCSPSF